MIDAGPSLRAAEGLSGATLAAYLLSRGWTARPSRVEGVSILSKDVEGADRPVLFVLPVVPGFTDEQRRVADALRTVSAVEETTVLKVADDARRFATAARGPGRVAVDDPPRKNEVVRVGTNWLDLDAGLLRDDEGVEHALTVAEFNLLKALAINPKRVLTREQLVDLVHKVPVHRYRPRIGRSWELTDLYVEIVEMELTVNARGQYEAVIHKPGRDEAVVLREGPQSKK